MLRVYHREETKATTIFACLVCSGYIAGVNSVYYEQCLVNGRE